MYAQEIASAMLKRQQAQAIVAARRQIVDGAVSMVKMALDELKEQGVVELDEERKANMVCNLLVVLCGEENAQPVITPAAFTHSACPGGGPRVNNGQKKSFSTTNRRRNVGCHASLVRGRFAQCECTNRICNP